MLKITEKGGIVKKLGSILLILLIAGCAHLNYTQELKDITPEKYQNANAYIAKDSLYIKLNSDGTYIGDHYKVIKILTDFGKKQFAEPSFGYMKTYDTLMVLKAKVYTPDGKVITVKKDEIKDFPLPAFKGSKFFLPNVRMVKIIYPSLEVGATIEYLVRDKMHNPPMENNFDYFDLFEDLNPYGKKVLVIDAPKDFPLKSIVKRGRISKKVVENGKRKIYIFEAENIPPIIREPGMPFFVNIATRLLISSVPSWKVWSKWYYNLAKKTFIVDSSLAFVIDSLTQGINSQKEKIRILYNYVNQNIRYVETTLSGKKGGYEPAPASVTLKRKYGVCRDKAAMLVAMLKYVGVDAYIVLTNPYMNVDKEIPADQFNHAIVAVKQNGEYFYLDPTAENSREYLPSIEENKGVLVCDSIGEDIALTPLSPPEKNEIITCIKSTMDKKRNVKGDMRMKTLGIFDFSFRSMLKNLPPEQSKNIFEMMLKSGQEDAKIDTIIIKNLENLDLPISVEMPFEIEKYGNLIGKELHLKMPLSGRGASIGMSMGGGNPFALEERKYPIYLFTTMFYASYDTLMIPKGWKIKSLPKPYKFENSYIKITQKVKKVKNKTIIIETASAFKKLLIPVSEYKKIRDIIKKVEKLSKREIILKK